MEEPQVELVQGSERADEPPTVVSVVWCGGANKGQDVNLRLLCFVPDKVGKSSKETLALLKVHSTKLQRFSKYFETCLSERWRSEAADTECLEDEFEPFEFVLEANADVEVYKDCFCRMYSPFRKDFGDVVHSLELLKVASQIEYHDLMDCLSIYMSAICWSDEDERRIRAYSSSPDFSRSHAQDLVLRLGLGEVREDDMKNVTEHIRELVLWWISNALEDGVSLNFRKFIKELLKGNMLCNVTETIVLVAKAKLVELDNKCLERIDLPVDRNRIVTPENLDHRVLDVCRILKIMLSAGVGEELVQCLLNLEGIRLYLTGYSNDIIVSDVAQDYPGKELAKIILLIYQEVVAGRLLLRTDERVALIDSWIDLLRYYLKTEHFEEATQALFLTLPLEVQITFLKAQEAPYANYISAKQLAALVNKNLSVVEETDLHVVKKRKL